MNCHFCVSDVKIEFCLYKPGVQKLNFKITFQFKLRY